MKRIVFNRKAKICVGIAIGAGSAIGATIHIVKKQNVKGKMAEYTEKVAECVAGKIKSCLPPYPYRITAIEDVTGSVAKEIVNKCISDNDAMEIKENIKKAALRISRFDISLKPEVNDKINEILYNVLEEIKLQPEEYQKYHDDLKKTISNIVSNATMNWDAKRAAEQAVRNEVFYSLSSNKKFLDSVDIERGVIKNEMITVAEYHKFRTEMQNNPKIKRFAFLVRKSTSSPYRIWTIAEYIDGKVTTRNGVVTGNAIFEEKESEMSFNEIYDKRRYAGYIDMVLTDNLLCDILKSDEEIEKLKKRNRS